MSKFRVGDKVRWVGNSDEGYCTAGKVYRVLRIEENETTPFDVVFKNDSGEEDKAFEQHFEHADPHGHDTRDALLSELAAKGPCTWDASVRVCFYCEADMGQGVGQDRQTHWHNDGCLWVRVIKELA